MKEYNDNNVGQNGYKEDEDWSFIGFEELAKESREALKKDDGYKYSSNPVIEDYYKSIEEENKQAYKDYIDRHHRPLIPGEDGLKERKEMVSKALAAQLLLDSPVTYEYSPRLITFVAQRVDKALDLKHANFDQLGEAVENHQAAKNLMYDQILKIYKVDKPEEYIEKMKTLYDNLMPKQGRSDEYKAFHNSVGKIAKLKVGDPHFRAKLYIYTFDLMRNTEGYAKGKKSVRLRTAGRERFNNSMDALAIMKKCVPGTGEMIDDIVDRTNEVRKVGKNDEYYVDLAKFGEQRALKASEERKQKELAKAKTNDKKLEKKMDNKYKAPGLM